MVDSSQKDTRIYISNNKFENSMPNGILQYFKLDDFSSSNPNSSGLSFSEIREYRLDNLGKVDIQLENKSTILILPLVNDLQLELRRLSKLLSVGHLALCDLEAGELFSITADKDQPEGMYFQLLIFNRTVPTIKDDEYFVLPIGEDLALNKLRLVNEDSKFPFEVYFGAFLSKQEDLLGIKESGKLAFCYCLEGCFEVESRLLFQGEGLSVLNSDDLDVECLSDRGLIILVIL